MRRAGNRLFDLMGCRGKTLWDFLGLLIVPVVIVLAGWWLSEASARSQQQIETDRAQQTILQSYIQDMTELLLDKELAKSQLDNPVRDIARSSTLAAVRQLDGERKGILLQFLSESNLITSGHEVRSHIDPIISLSGADLSGAFLIDADLSGAFLIDADLSGADLSGADLIGADLSGADLINANLIGASLYGAFLIDADLSGANLGSVSLGGGVFRSGANLGHADLTGAHMRNTNLSGADLAVAILSGANLGSANLSGANLRYASLNAADLSYANLIGADLSYANLSFTAAGLAGARNWTNGQLAQAKSLVGARMPNGTKMTEESWEEFKKRYRQSSAKHYAMRCEEFSGYPAGFFEAKFWRIFPAGKNAVYYMLKSKRFLHVGTWPLTKGNNKERG
jgi:uncharacterized protein YjbI with pentapeptide repeats